jgi:hypothetical protein
VDMLAIYPTGATVPYLSCREGVKTFGMKGREVDILALYPTGMDLV